MSIKEKLANKNKQSAIFAIVGGLRLGGKSSIAGTLTGKTLMLQAAELETGSSSALALAEEKGNTLDVVSFESFTDLLSILGDSDIEDYDNVYIDGLSAINEMRFSQEDVQRAKKKNVWDAYGILAEDMRKVLRTAKRITYKGSTNVFITLAYKPTIDANGNISLLKPDVKGNVTMSEIQRLAPTVLAVRAVFDEDGTLVRQLLTKSDDVYPARVDTLLDHNNPGVLDADLSLVVNLINKK